jgi:diadenosine tetraphosphate (Ap4A) HIT family hydrolase
VVRVDEPDYPGFVRVILGRHATEMADLGKDERDRFMAVVFAVETAVRDTMKADKMNLASLGNQTPHLHWHVIPRFRDDRHFPGPIWAQPLRDRVGVMDRELRAAGLPQALVARLGA